MYDWTVLHQTVSETLAGGRVGVPLFVRWTAAAAQHTADLKPLLAEMSAYAEIWLSANPRRIYAAGSADKGHLSVALEYENGESAVLAITLAHDHPSMNLAILGARGSIFHTGAQAPAPTENSASGKDERMQQSTVLSSSNMVAAIDRSLLAKKPVSLSLEGDQT